MQHWFSCVLPARLLNSLSVKPLASPCLRSWLRLHVQMRLWAEVAAKAPQKATIKNLAPAPRRSSLSSPHKVSGCRCPATYQWHHKRCLRGWNPCFSPFVRWCWGWGFMILMFCSATSGQDWNLIASKTDTNRKSKKNIRAENLHPKCECSLLSATSHHQHILPTQPGWWDKVGQSCPQLLRVSVLKLAATVDLPPLQLMFVWAGHKKNIWSRSYESFKGCERNDVSYFGSHSYYRMQQTKKPHVYV